MCSYYLDGEPAPSEDEAGLDLPCYVALVQFSSSSEGPQARGFPTHGL
jgi:hypothetical protein